MQESTNAFEPGAVATQLNKRFGRYSIIVGFLLILLGSVGIVLPKLMSLETSLFIASLFLVGGIFWLSHSFKYSRKDWADWLKPVLLLVTGGFMMFYPMSGIAAIGLLLAVYLLLDAFGSFSFASSMGSVPGSGWMMFNGVLSLILAMMFLIGWPATSMFLVGLYVAISLFFDGVVLVYIGWNQRHLSS